MAQARKAASSDQGLVTEHLEPRLRVGSRLLADAYAGDGALLLRAGAEVGSKRRLLRLSQSDVRFGDERSTEIPIDMSRERELEERELATAEFHDCIERARSLRDEVVSDITAVFSRIESAGKVDVGVAENAASSLVSEMVCNSRALVSLTRLKDADSYTFTHSVNVGILSIYLAMCSGFSDDIEDIAVGALLHDIGKVRIPPSILQKPATLSADEWQLMRRHSEMGVEILEASGGYSEVIRSCVLDHHEKFNGVGYPNAKKGSEIARHARTVAIADVYDALTTDRPYRKAMDPRDAMMLMTDQMSNGFDPALLRRFVAAVGYFPVGSKVKLSDGCLGVVVRNHPTDPLRPAVEIVSDAQGDEVRRFRAVDLRSESGVFVVQFLRDRPLAVGRAA